MSGKSGGLVRECPQNPLNSGLGIILICPDVSHLQKKRSLQNSKNARPVKPSPKTAPLATSLVHPPLNPHHGIYRYIWFRVPCCHPPPPPPMVWVPPPPPIPHAFCTRHCCETYISILLHARRCSETHIFILLDEPSRRIRWVDRAKLWRNANFKLQEWLRYWVDLSMCAFLSPPSPFCYTQIVGITF